MATATYNLISTMPLLILVLILTLDFADAQIGVCYGGNGNDLPSKPDVIALCNQNNIRRLRIYDPDQGILQAAGGSNIELIVGVPNDKLQDVAASQANADTWVQNNIKNYPNVKFRYIAVGNEVSPARGETAQYTGFVFLAMQNIYNAISSAGLADQIKVSTALESGVLENTVPPGNSNFRGDVTGYVNPIIGFLVEKGYPLLVNVYPYFAYLGDKANIPLDYALFTSDRQNEYQNLFDALVDSMYAALEKNGGSSLKIVVAESGWPSEGDDGASLDNARTYYTNLVQHVNGGTPKKREAIETYLFSLLDENRKEPEIEKHFGVFRSNKEPKYGISFG